MTYRVKLDEGDISSWLFERSLVLQDYRWDEKVRYYDGRVEAFVIPVHSHEGI